jgi:hypothetical protein
MRKTIETTAAISKNSRAKTRITIRRKTMAPIFVKYSLSRFLNNREGDIQERSTSRLFGNLSSVDSVVIYHQYIPINLPDERGNNIYDIIYGT